MTSSTNKASASRGCPWRGDRWGYAGKKCIYQDADYREVYRRKYR